MSIVNPLNEYKPKYDFDFIEFRVKQWKLKRKEVVSILNFWDLEAWKNDAPLEATIKFIKKKGIDRKIEQSRGKFTYRMVLYLMYQYERYKTQYWEDAKVYQGKLSEIPRDKMANKRDLTAILKYRDKPLLRPLPRRDFAKTWQSKGNKKQKNWQYKRFREFLVHHDWLEDEVKRLTKENEELKQKQST